MTGLPRIYLSEGDDTSTASIIHETYDDVGDDVKQATVAHLSDVLAARTQLNKLEESFPKIRAKDTCHIEHVLESLAEMLLGNWD